MDTIWTCRTLNTLLQCEHQLQGVKVKRDYNPCTKTNSGSRPTMVSCVAATFYLDEGPSPRGQRSSVWGSSFLSFYYTFLFPQPCFLILFLFFFFTNKFGSTCPSTLAHLSKVVTEQNCDGNKTGFPFEEIPSVWLLDGCGCRRKTERISGLK